MTASPSAQSTDLANLLAHQRRRHLVAQYMTVRRWRTQLQDTLLEGRSPTGYGAPLAPLPRDQAERVLAPVDALLDRLRQFVAEYAGAELREVERQRSPNETRRWTAVLLDRLRDAAGEIADDARKRRHPTGLEQDAEDLVQEADAAVAAALEALDAASTSGHQATSGDDAG